MSFMRCTTLALVAASVVLVGATLSTAQEKVVQMVAELLGDADKDIRALALEQVRGELPGAENTRRLAELLPKLPPETQVGLLNALKERGDQAAAPAVRALLSTGETEPVRVAAIKALGALGEPADHAALIAQLADSSEAIVDAAYRSLILLPGDDSSAVIAGALASQSPALQVKLIEILTIRRARNTIPTIERAAIAHEPEVRAAAMESLGSLAATEQIPAMLQGVLMAEAGKERDAAERAVAEMCQRMDDPEQAAEALVKAIDTLPDEQSLLLLSTLGRVGGSAARHELEQVIAEAKHHDLGLQALCNWPDGSIGFRLLELARTEKDAANRQRALLALVRVAPLADERTDELRLDLLRTALVMCRDDADRRRVIDRAKAIRSLESMRFARSFLGDAKYAQQACVTIVELAHHSSLREANKEEFHAALDEVIAKSSDPVVVDRAQRYKKGQTWVRPK